LTNWTTEALSFLLGAEQKEPGEKNKIIISEPVDKSLCTESNQNVPSPSNGFVQCGKCTSSCLSRTDLSKHYENVHKLYLCEQCPLAFPQFVLLRKHTYRNHRPCHKCKWCPRTFYNIDTAKQHMQKHYHPNKSKIFKCGMCPSYYYLQGNLTQHQVKVHGMWVL